MIKARIFAAFLGFSLALAGIYLENRPLIWASMVVLAVTLALRYWARGKPTPRSDD